MKQVLKFNASWCSPCAMLKKVIEGIDNLPVQIKEIDIGKDSELSSKYRIRIVPTCVLLSDTGEEISRKSGAMTKEQFLEFIRG